MLPAAPFGRRLVQCSSGALPVTAGSNVTYAEFNSGDRDSIVFFGLALSERPQSRPGRKKKMKRIAITLAMGAMLAGGLFAQDPTIQQRKENQQDRIANGVKDGTLTPHETSKLENKEAKINQETRADRKQNGGNLTNKEKAKINRQQNHVSKQIYKDKHNGK
jgi:hypothetical protein